jgi:hypothetical protein
MHHKRKGPKSTRAGCLLCKPHKRQGTRLKHRPAPGATARRLLAASADLRAAGLARFDKGVR